MDIKERLNRHLEYDWLKYVIILAASVALWVLLYTTVNNYKDFEIIHVFALVDGGYKETARKEYESGVLAKLSESGDTAVLQSTFEISTCDTSGAAELAMTRLITADILIFPKGYVENNFYSFLELTDGIISENGWESHRFFETEGKKYAVEITPGEGYFEKLSDLFILSEPEQGAEAERYFLGFSKSSTNIGAYSSSKKAGAENNQAFLAANLFLSKYK